MFPVRLMPCLLLKNKRLVKTVAFKEPSYIGDPLNAVRLFSEKGVDELIILDIDASLKRKKPQFDMLADIASECFVPLAYGGGIRDMSDLKTLFSLGAEKAILNSEAVRNPDFITAAAQFYGSQSIVVSMDVRKDFFGKYRVYILGGRKRTAWHPSDLAREVETRGAGEILLTSIASDGTWQGYDLDLIHQVARTVRIPVVACGGAGCLDDCLKAIQVGASAAAAGSLFVYKGKAQGVLINFPERNVLNALFKSVSA